MTVDLEPDLRSTTCKSMELIPKILEFFDKYDVKATFFTVTSLLEKYESEIKEISRKHEIASHSHTHTLGKTEIGKSMDEMKKFGLKCKGYRAPGFIVGKNHFQELKEAGYEYDSSLARYFPGRYSNWNLPTKPYKNNGITEFPMPTFVWPSVNSGLTYLKLFNPVSKLFPKKYMFYFHPWELMKTKGPFHLTRNSGSKAWQLLRKQVEGSKWVGCEEWIKKKKN